MSYAQAIREQIVTARKARGWSQTQLAEKAGIKQSTVSRIESTARGIGVDEFVAIAKVLGLNAGDMLPNSAGLISRDIKPLVETLKRLEPAVRERTLRIVEHIVGIQDDLRIAPQRSAEVVQFPQRTIPRWTEEFPVQPNEFIEKEFDFPREYVAETIEEDHAAAGVSGVDADADHMTAQVLNGRHIRSGKLRVVRVHGDSMSDGTKWSMEDGELWSVDPTFSEPREGATVAVYIKDEGSVFGVLRRNDSGWQLEKRNEAYQPIRLPSEPDAWRLVGRVYRCEQSAPLPSGATKSLLPKRRKR